MLDIPITKFEFTELEQPAGECSSSIIIAFMSDTGWDILCRARAPTHVVKIKLWIFQFHPLVYGQRYLNDGVIIVASVSSLSFISLATFPVSCT